eukprot:55899-Chlamydomonas_euryale.AAC.1
MESPPMPPPSGSIEPPRASPPMCERGPYASMRGGNLPYVNWLLRFRQPALEALAGTGFPQVLSAGPQAGSVTSLVPKVAPSTLYRRGRNFWAQK